MPACPDIADAGEPDGGGRCGDSDRGLLDHANAVLFECLLDTIVVEPAIVVAEDRDDPSRRAKLVQFGRDRLRRHEAPANHPLNDEIAQDADHVRAGGVRAIDDVAQFADAVEWRPDVKIGQDGNPQ